MHQLSLFHETPQSYCKDHGSIGKLLTLKLLERDPNIGRVSNSLTNIFNMEN